MNVRIDRRQFLLTGVAISAAGFSARRAVAADARLRMAWWGGKARAELTQKAIDLYVSKHPGVQVETEYLGWGDYWARLSTQTSGGNSPDIVQIDIEYLADYATRGVLLPLEPLIPKPLDVSDFQPDLLGNGKVDGKQYAVPCGVNAGALVLDKTAFDEAGVALPDHNTTWAQFESIMAEFTKRTPRKGMFGSTDASGSEAVLETWLRQRGKQLYHPDGTLAYDQTDMTGWFEMWEQMRSSGAAAPAEVEALDHGEVDSSLLSQGKAALAFENSNQFVAFQSLTKDQLALAPYPKVDSNSKGGLYIKPTMFYSISSQSKNPQAAAELLDFILRDPEATVILGGERGVPASASVRERLRPKMDAAGDAMVDYIDGLGDLAGTLPPPNPPGGSEVTDALIAASQEVAFKTKTAAQGAADFVEKAKQILDRAK
ncbi:ABC transporter substrate-binding protein [Dongia sedimenti]|uniref:Extracellular solute-binding protein n=1 Tax=Dongia sedimenti TaxID=3064282 RepID=A0ABU0YEP4_9PROT|nr:extracellular solute-binding protein [Rhodospirillaceae bacterium R-7]